MNYVTPEVLKTIGRHDAIATRPPVVEPPRECIELFHAVDALRTADTAIAVQFVAPTGPAGTTTVASGFARAAGQRAVATLYIDCTPTAETWPTRVPCSLAQTILAADPLDRAIVPSHDAPGVSWARLDDGGQGSLRHCGPAALSTLLGALRDRFSILVLDCPPFLHSDVPLSLARHCDGTILVIHAGATRSGDMTTVRDKIGRLGGQVVGSVFNSFRPPSRRAGPGPG